ncbi:MAG: hypothetical protein ACM3VT_09600, partial [Solirubrobacterales bacterium]
VAPPNRLFEKMREAYYRHSIENRIFDLHWRERGNEKAVPQTVAAECRNESANDSSSPAGGGLSLREFPSSPGRSLQDERVSCSRAKER